ncbi:HDOD domain-containing protein [Gallaecimonas kandeliae]|uniref:HDOD domain-containing protein n=1 Tax=Gallaecimonas kandeliae TaxID=3029055 RepID=UPI0026478237|nr:HDOD domain-containing protein [Gallaecimonas kandeliae]WKE64675.1 HDOD domain-containing protein [Gallaecimonas kandeliae]
MDDLNLDTAFYDALFGDQGQELNPLELQALGNLRAVLDDRAALSTHIPPLPTLLLQLVQLLADPKADFDKISALIEGDPALSLEVLRIANSALYSRGGASLDTLRAAVGRLGVTGVAAIASTILAEKLRPPKPIYFKMFGRDIWLHSLHCAFLCRELAKEQGEDPFVGHFLGLIHDVGKIIVFNCLLDAFSQGVLDGVPGSQLFKALMSEMSLDISPFVAKEWGLPEQYCTALQQQRSQPKTLLARILRQANGCAELYLLKEKRRIGEELLDEKLGGLACPAECWQHFLDKAPLLAASVR